ncbi:septum formation initiator family protein [Mollicutes bacterium LVI A0039]|nr:septum formation initiator family protein [Mollicutes bacterium LVI A0039]
MKKNKIRDIIIITFCLVASFQMITSVKDPYIEVKTEKEDLRLKIEQEQEKNETLQKSLDQSLSSPETEKSYIRERFHMSEKDELIFVFPDNE